MCMRVLMDFDGSTIRDVYKRQAWVNTADYWNVRFNLLERYKNIFDENGIEIPFNQLDVHMK